MINSIFLILLSSILLSIPHAINSFTPQQRPIQNKFPLLIFNSKQSTTRLFNVPPPSTSDPEALKKASDREPPPASFYDLQIKSSRATQLAIEDGYKLVEVEFPPLPANILEMDDVSSYDVSLANLKLAIDFAKFFSQNSRSVAILLPDDGELSIALDALGGDPRPHPNVLISALRRSDEGDERVFKPEQVFLDLLGKSSGAVKTVEGVDMYVIIGASAQELPDVEELYELEGGTTPIVFYNLKLETLRGDLGAPAFPPRDFQDRFLSKVKPAYYLLPRSYSRSTPNPPFLLNYQGALFRSYPGEFQTLLDTGTGSYRRVKGNAIRPGLGEFKAELTEALQTEGVIEEEGKFLGFLRTGYKTSTWWEGDREEASNDWRS